MAMLDIEYRYSGKSLGEAKIRRTSTKEMEQYIRDLVCEMQAADISVKFVTGFAIDGEKNMVYINGRSVPDILDGLNIVIPDPEDDGQCGCHSQQVPITIGGPNLKWNQDYIEDIPDILMKNAISKVYADMNRDALPVQNDYMDE